MRSSLGAAAALFAGCGAPRPPAVAVPLDSAAVRQEAADGMRAALRAVDDLDLAALDTIFLADSGVVSVEDTVVTVGATAIAAAFRTALAGIKGVDSAAFEWVHVIPLGPDAAVAVARFREIVTLPDGTRILDRGAWSSTFRRTAGGWKMVTAHVSHPPAAPRVIAEQ